MLRIAGWHTDFFFNAHDARDIHGTSIILWTRPNTRFYIATVPRTFCQFPCGNLSAQNIEDLSSEIYAGVLCVCVCVCVRARVRARMCVWGLHLLCQTCPMLASYPAFMDGRKEHLVLAVCACAEFFQKSGKPCYFGILLRNGHWSDSDDEFSLTV